MTAVPLRLKLVGFVVLVILGFSLVGVTLEMVKEVRAAESQQPVLIRDQFAALQNGNAPADSDGPVLAGLKYA